MQKHPQLKFIIRNPDGKIQLATQPQVKDIKLIKCRKCEKVNTVRDMTKIECCNCGAMVSATRCDEPNCKGDIEIVYLGSLIVKECTECKKVVPIHWYLLYLAISQIVLKIIEIQMINSRFA